MAEVGKSAEQKYFGVQGSRDRFRHELDQAIVSGDVENARRIKQQLEAQIKELRAEVDPFQYRLRNEFAKEYDYDYVGIFGREGFARARQANGWVYVNRRNEPLNLTDPNLARQTFAEAFPFKEGVARAKMHMADTLLFIKPDGKQVPGTYFEAEDFSQGFAAGKYDTSYWAFFDQRGISLKRNGENVAVNFKKAKSFSANLAPVVFPTEFDWTFIDISGETRVDLNGDAIHFEEANSFSDEFAAVKDASSPDPEKKWTFVNTNLQNSGLGYFDEVTDFIDGIAAVRKDGYWWFIDKNGNRLFGDREFAEVRGFSDEIAIIRNRLETNYYYIDKEGNSVYELKEGDIPHDFCEGVARVARVSAVFNPQQESIINSYYIDRKGNKIF